MRPVNLNIRYVIALLLFFAPLLAKSQLKEKESMVVTESFLTYMKAVMNPYKYGLTNGVFYPYSTRYGRRIGWGLEIKDKSLYKSGQTVAQADAALKAGLEAIIPPLNAFLKENYGGIDFSGLEEEQQQILLDRAFTEGIENLPENFCKAVLSSDWESLVNGYLYIRKPEGWPDIIRNHAFAQRWIYGKTGKALISSTGK